MDKNILIHSKDDMLYPITKSKNVKCDNNKSLEDNLKEVNSKLDYVKGLAPGIDNLRDSIKNFKVSVGDAKPEDVLENKTFSNSTQVGLKGNVKNKGILNIKPNKVMQTFDKGFYNQIKCEPISVEAAKQSLSNNDINKIFKEKNPELKPENVKEGITIGNVIGTNKSIITKTINTNEFTVEEDLSKLNFSLLIYADYSVISNNDHMHSVKTYFCFSTEFNCDYKIITFPNTDINYKRYFLFSDNDWDRNDYIYKVAIDVDKNEIKLKFIQEYGISNIKLNKVQIKYIAF